MQTELIDDATLEAIPDNDPENAFVLFERACRKSLIDAIRDEESGNVIGGLQLDYVHDVVAAAQHYGIPDICDYKLPKSGMHYQDFEDFSRRVRFFTTRFRLNAKAQRNKHSVELQGTHLDRIRTLIAHMKIAIDKSDFSDSRKRSLLRHIAEFEKALDGKRLGLAEAMIFVGLIGAGLHGVGEGAEGIAKLVQEISIAIGQSKAIEDTSLQARPKLDAKPPTYLLEGHVSKGQFSREEMEDEIPF